MEVAIGAWMPKKRAVCCQYVAPASEPQDNVGTCLLCLLRVLTSTLCLQMGGATLLQAPAWSHPLLRRISTTGRACPPLHAVAWKVGEPSLASPPPLPPSASMPQQPATQPQLQQQPPQLQQLSITQMAQEIARAQRAGSMSGTTSASAATRPRVFKLTTAYERLACNVAEHLQGGVGVGTNGSAGSSIGSSSGSSSSAPNPMLDERSLLVIIRDLASALAHLSSHNVEHCDVKPEVRVAVHVCVPRGELGGRRVSGLCRDTDMAGIHAMLEPVQASTLTHAWVEGRH